MPNKVQKKELELECFFKNPIDKKDIVHIFKFDKLKKIMVQKK